VDRRLAAILAADVVGYSRLMEQDESGTMEALRARRKGILQPLVDKHHGRIFKITGDGVLVEFGSAVNAVQCAIELQQEMSLANSDLPDGRHIQLRIGVNLGDVMVEGGDLYGDGINIAARLEGIAEPGSVVISGTTCDYVRNKIGAQFEDLGAQNLKNISEPVRAYRISGPQAVTAGPARSTADKPTIAVLPFTNMSGDQEQEYFSDGITEDIITELSRFGNLLVVARNSSFTFKGRPVDVTEVGRRLGARYIVEGSVRKADRRVRITAQLLESATGNHLWAERYDRNMEDIFAVQDEVVRAIAGAIPGRLDRIAVANLRRKPPENFTAYDCELRGRSALAHWHEGLDVALEWYEKAVKADPDYALAHAGIALVYAYGIYILGLEPDAAIARAREHARRATVLDDKNPIVHAYAALAYMLACDHEPSRVHADRAVSLNPNDPFVLFTKANILTYAGEQELALEFFAKSEKLEPYSADDQRLDVLCDCHYLLGNYEKVIQIHSTYQHVPALLMAVLAACYAQLDRRAEAKAALEEFEKRRSPSLDLPTAAKCQARMCWRQKDHDHWLDGYRKAGVDV
jgi:TolB-like protein